MPVVTSEPRTRREMQRVDHGRVVQKAEATGPSTVQGAGLPALGHRFGQFATAPPAANRSGLPTALRAGIESLSGVSMAGVRVHYNSSRPAQLAAHAYARDPEIHLSLGQERHLPHEAWHIVQQRQGRVPATAQLKGIAVNADRGLEREADVMGARAARQRLVGAGPSVNGSHETVPPYRSQPAVSTASSCQRPVLQAILWSHSPTSVDGLQTHVDWDTRKLSDGTEVGIKMVASPLGPEHKQGTPPRSSVHKELMARLETTKTNAAKDKYIKGHLLNDNVGGPGEALNLFPITAQANRQHEQEVESFVKNAVNDERQWVQYLVRVDSIEDNLMNPSTRSVNAIFHCEVNLLKPSYHPDGTLQAVESCPWFVKNIISKYQCDEDPSTDHYSPVHPNPKGPQASSVPVLLSIYKKQIIILDNIIDKLKSLYTHQRARTIVEKCLGAIGGIGAMTVEGITAIIKAEIADNVTAQNTKAIDAALAANSATATADTDEFDDDDSEDSAALRVKNRNALNRLFRKDRLPLLEKQIENADKRCKNYVDNVRIVSLTGKAPESNESDAGFDAERKWSNQDYKAGIRLAKRNKKKELGNNYGRQSGWDDFTAGYEAGNNGKPIQRNLGEIAGFLCYQKESRPILPSGADHAPMTTPQIDEDDELTKIARHELNRKDLPK